MIPKIVHQIWVGDSPPINIQKCINSVKHFSEDYNYILWDYTELSKLDNIPNFVTNLYHEKKYAEYSDYMRIHILSVYGGIYLDADIQLVKHLDIPLDINAIGCSENDVASYTSVGFLAATKEVAEQWLLDTTMIMETNVFSLMPIWFSDILKKTNNHIILPSETFYPYAWDNEFNSNCIKPTTIGIHHWAASWHDDGSYIKDKFNKLEL